MMSYRYRYTGTQETVLMGYGRVKPEEVVTLSVPINNPLYVLEQEKQDTPQEPSTKKKTEAKKKGE